MIWFADFETDVSNGKAEVYLGYIERLETNDGCLFLTIDDMMKYLCKYNTKKTHTVYFHNLSWDGEFIIWWLITNGYEPQLSKVSKPKQFRERTDWMGKRGEIYVNVNGCRILFLCSYKMWPIKAEKIGESLGYPKLKIEHNIGRHYQSVEEIPADVIDYVKRDVEIIKHKYIEYGKNYEIKKTASSSSWNNFVKWYEGKYSKQTFTTKYLFNKETFNYLSPAYFGGLSIINDFHRYEDIKGNIKYYDINSSYPSTFTDNLQPYGLPLDVKPDGDYVYIVDAIIKNPKKKDKRMASHLHNWVKFGKVNRESYLDEYNGPMRVMYCSEEWEEIKLSYDFEILQEKNIYFKASRELGEYINLLYHLKENAKDKVEKGDHKLILNSFYGKWGQNYLQTRKDLYLATAEDDLKYHYGKYVYRTSVEESKEIKYLPIAIFTTSYARVKLLRVVRQNLDTWLYGDTDSLIINGDKCEGIKEHETKLGYWKLEAEGKRFKVLKTKCYIMEMMDGTLKRTLAGITDSGKSLINFDNFYVGSVIKNGNRKKKKLKGGYVLIDEDTTL